VQPQRDLDATLITRARAGDPDARGDLVTSIGPSIWTSCRRMDPDPEDAYQAIWERVFLSLHRFDPHREGSLRAWVLTITRRMLVDRHRRRTVRGNVVQLDGLSVPAVVEDALDSASRKARLNDALQRLPDSQRRAVVFHHLQGTSLETLAHDEGVALGTIKSRLHRGRARLLALLEDM
jgi:RNA polymerase sigma-70 factor (ECF subfamily)